MCWNCRGIASPYAIRSLRANIRVYQPDVVFLSEIILLDVNTVNIVNRLGFSMYVNSPPNGKWGGLLFVWRKGLDVETVFINSNVMSLFVYSDPAYNPWLLNLVYCPAQNSHK